MYTHIYTWGFLLYRMENLVDTSKLRGIVPESILSEIPMIMSQFNINTPLRLAHFLGQVQHESGGFRSTVENLNYSVDGLHRVFNKYFSQPGLAEKYARHPEKIASRVYANRMGNGDETSTDGWKFRGRGLIQLTGKSNYSAFAKAINEDVVSNPDLVATKYPLSSAAWFFAKSGLNEVADRGQSKDVVTSVTKRINGGTNGLAERITNFNKLYKVLTS